MKNFLIAQYKFNLRADSPQACTDKAFTYKDI